jgi:adenosylmethionine-8-amino-7-oxononanoate aminotransferase
LEAGIGLGLGPILDCANRGECVLANSVKYPEGHVLLRKLDATLPLIEKGEGIYLYDKEGRRYIDASGGALVCSLGHGQKEIVDFISEQIQKVAYINGNHFATDISEELAEKLCARAPGRLNRAFFLSSGSEAIECAIKFVRQYFFDQGFEAKHKVIARSPGYHGNTLFALSASGRPRYKKYFGPLLHDIYMISTPYEYRSPIQPYDEKATEYYLNELEDLIAREGVDSIACVVLEPISGTSTGGSCPPPHYLRRLQELCSKHNIFTIADEVLCGVGRTGTFYASSAENFEPDVMVLGKGLNGGYAPLSAMLVRDECVQKMAHAGGFMHAQTYVNTPSSVAAGLAVVNFMDRHRVLEKAQAVGEYFQLESRKRFLNLDHVGHIAGRGHLLGIEFVQDKKTKKPFDRSKKVAEKITEDLFQNGLVTWVNSGQVDGTHGDILVLGPPLTSTQQQIDEILEVLQRRLAPFGQTIEK